MKISHILGVFAAFCAPIDAGIYNVPKEESVVAIEFPEAWKVIQEDDTIDARSKDESIQLYVQLDDADTLEASIEKSIKYFKDEGVVVDVASQKQTEGEINAMAMTTVKWEGVHGDAPTKVALSFITVAPEEFVTLLYWGDDNFAKANVEVLQKIMMSIKSLKAGAEEAGADEGEEIEAE